MKNTSENHNNTEAIISYETASEYGTIEKLCPKYGFIKCQSKENQDKRLFFHYTATKNPFEELQVGDNVTFQRGISKGKPLAKEIIFQSHVETIEGVIVRMPKKCESGSICYKFNEECFYLPFTKQDLLMDDVKLKVKDEVLFEKGNSNSIDKGNSNGSGNDLLLAAAVKVRKKYNKPIKVQGIVTSVKERFGFIDRSDIVKEIYFNLSSVISDGVSQLQSIQPGVELEFNVKHLRNGKEEAVNLRILERGTVQFVDVIDRVIYGTLLRSPDCRRATNGGSVSSTNGANGGGGSTGGAGDPLAGNISYVCNDSDTNECSMVRQIPFGEHDKKYQYSLHPGDIVAFKVAIDRRDQLQRACQVELCLDSFPSRKELRQIGVVRMFDEQAGLIEPDLPAGGNGGANGGTTDEDMLVAFKAREWLVSGEGGAPLARFAVVSYTPLQLVRNVTGNANGNTHKVTTTTALRILPLPATEADKLQHLKLYPAGKLKGTVKCVPHGPDDIGIICCQFPDSRVTRTVAFTSEDLIGCRPKAGDEVQFGCLDRIACQYLPPTAFNIELVPVPSCSTSSSSSSANNSSSSRAVPSDAHNIRKLRSRTLPGGDKSSAVAITSPMATAASAPIMANRNLRGWIVIFKEYFGFVETADHSALYKFNPIIVKKSKFGVELKVGTAIEFLAVPSSGTRPRRIIEQFLAVLTDPLANENTVAKRRIGIIMRPLYISENTDKDNQYCGLVNDIDTDDQYPYSMTGLVSFRTKLSPSDRVLFDVVQESHREGGLSNCLATNVILLRQIGRVSSVTKSKVCIERQINEEDSDNGLPVVFDLDLNATTSGNLSRSGADIKCLNVNDTIQFDLDIDRSTESRNLFVSAVKLLKCAEQMPPPAISGNSNSTSSISGTRKVYKAAPVDDLIPRILHVRGPRLPDGETNGFTEQLRRMPRLHC